MKNKSLLLSLILLLKIYEPSYAQNKTFSDVLEVNLRNFNAIIKDNEVKGYYAFYKVDKVDKNSNAYMLQILDQNLNEVAKKDIVDSKYLYLQEAAFDGNSIMLKFYEAKLKQLILKKFSTKGEFESKKTIPIVGTMESIYYSSGGTGEEIKNKNVFAIEGKGFVNYTPKKISKMGYYIDFIASDASMKDWNYKSSASSDFLESATFLAASGNVLTSVITKKSGALSKDMDNYLLGIDLTTGKKIFEQKIEDKKYEVQVLNGFADAEKEDFLLTGLYFNKGAKEGKDKSVGLFSYRMDKSGNITNTTYISWMQDVSKVIPVNEKGKLADVGNLYFHKVVKTADGKIYAIAESFKKAASAGGIALNALAALGGGNSGAAAVKLVIEDMFIFQFSPNFTLEAVKTFDKGKSNFNLPQGAGLSSPQLLGYFVAAYDGYDYNFTQMNQGNTVFHVGYTDLEKNKGEKNTWVFGAITYVNGEYKVDKISLETEATNIAVYPAKPGYVLISEYFRKTKKIETRFEKINY